MDNPYAAPESLPAATAPADPKAVALASRWLRLAAALIDSLIGGGSSLVIIFLVLGYDLQRLGAADLPTKALLALMGVALFMLFHGYLLAKNGQTIGKKLVGIRVALLDGAVPPFVPLILKRYVPVWLVVQIPIVGAFINLANILFIFRADRRCLHDLIAGTMVVKAA
jgi:uncharacterized RDD family membrane protein YckC